MRFIFFLYFFIFLLFPYFIFFSDIQIPQELNLVEFVEAFRNSFVLSFLSALFCTILGILGGLSLLNVPLKKISRYIIIFLIPTFLPHLYILISVLGLHDSFPFGIVGMVYVHALIYSGLSSVLIYEILTTRISKFSELALVEGASRWDFLWVCLKYIKKDLGSVYIGLFIIFFTSFSIPLVIGKDTLTVEILIYEKIKIMGEYGQALSFAFFQTALLIFLSFLLRPTYRNNSLADHRNMSLISVPYFYWFFVFISAGMVFSPFQYLISRLEDLKFVFSDFNLTFNKILQMSFVTFFISFGVGISIYFLSFAAIFISDSKTFKKFLMSYVTPGTALIGFSLILLDLSFLKNFEVFFKVILGLSFIMMPALYRFHLVNHFDSLENQIQVSQTMGAGSVFVFSKIIFPQMHRYVCTASGLSAFWAASDFSISQFLFEKTESWSLFIFSIMSTYQIDKAFVFILVPLSIGAIAYSFFQGLHYVIYSEHK